MDFNDTKAEAEFRAEARAFLNKHMKPLGPGETNNMLAERDDPDTITRDFTMGRYAFGRPIASFQALKHRMADLYVKIELAKSNCFWAAWALSENNPELALAAPSARVAATDAFDTAAVEMVQMHGGVGFTWEYDCHLFYRRAKHQAVALGSPAHWREKLVQRLIAKQAA